jgi:hypothetical protein
VIIFATLGMPLVLGITLLLWRDSENVPRIICIPWLIYFFGGAAFGVIVYRRQRKIIAEVRGQK